MKASSVRVFASVILFIGALFLVMALQLPTSPYEPLGSGTLPAALCAIICILSITVILFPHKAGAVTAAQSTKTPSTKTETKKQTFVGLTICIMALFVAFVIVMQAEILGFVWATVLFLCSVMTLMVRSDPRVADTPRAWMLTLVIALVTGFGLQFIFTQLLVINLP